MSFHRSRLATGGGRAATAALLALLLASCAATGDPTVGFAPPGTSSPLTASISSSGADSFAGATFNSASGEAVPSADQADEQVAEASPVPDAESEAAPPQTAEAAPAPDEVIYTLEQLVPAQGEPAQQQVAAAAASAIPEGAAADESGRPADEAVAQGPEAGPEPSGAAIESRIEVAHGLAPEAPAETAATPPAAGIEPQKKGFLSAFFSPSPANAAPAPQARQPRPMVQLASTGAAAQRPVVARASAGSDNALPGVRQSALFEITRRSGLDDDDDVDLYEGQDRSVQVASAAGLARLAPNGLLKQTDHVDVACLKPALVRTLNTIERHFGRKVMVTSGYRDPDRNRRARGARNSLHMYCAAADIQVAGVSKWDLAQFVRTMPGRGGVGTYCHTESIHVDVGPERDWNWRCRRRR